MVSQQRSLTPAPGRCQETSSLHDMTHANKRMLYVCILESIVLYGIIGVQKLSEIMCIYMRTLTDALHL